jgi:hypothetical protein
MMLVSWLFAWWMYHSLDPVLAEHVRRAAAEGVRSRDDGPRRR